MDVARAWFGLACALMLGRLFSPCMATVRPKAQGLAFNDVSPGAWLGLRDGDRPLRLTWLSQQQVERTGWQSGDLLQCQDRLCCHTAQHMPLAWRLLLKLPIPIDTIGPDEWDRLPKIGPKRAEAIAKVQLRDGPFKQPEQLQQIGGIGPATVAHWLGSCRLEPAQSPKRTWVACIPRQDLP